MGKIEGEKLAVLVAAFLAADAELVSVGDKRDKFCERVVAAMAEAGVDALCCGQEVITLFDNELSILDAHDLRADLEKIADG